MYNLGTGSNGVYQLTTTNGTLSLAGRYRVTSISVTIRTAKGEEIDLATLGADDDGPTYRRHNPRMDRHIMDEDDADAAVGQTVATDALNEGYLLEKSELDGYEKSDREDDFYEEEFGYEAESYDESYDED